MYGESSPGGVSLMRGKGSSSVLGRDRPDPAEDESRARTPLPGQTTRRSHTLLAPFTHAFSCPRSVGGAAVSGSRPKEPPDAVHISLDEALELLAALEDARDVLIETDHLSVLAQVVYQIRLLSSRIGFDQGGSYAS